MKATLAILAVTAMKTGVCIAGVRAEAPSTWIRPVREFGSIQLGDVTYVKGAPPASALGRSGEKRVMCPFDLAQLTLGHRRPDPPHVEDWTCDFAHQRPRLLGIVPEAERTALLEAAACAPERLWRGEGSLGVVALDDFTATFTYDDYTGKYEARVSFHGLPADMASAACTDLKWRALGRRLLAERGQMGQAEQGTGQGTGADDVRRLTLAGGELRRILGVDRFWAALGTSRARDGRHWPLIVGMHMLPDYEAEIDYRTL